MSQRQNTYESKLKAVGERFLSEFSENEKLSESEKTAQLVADYIEQVYMREIEDSDSIASKSFSLRELEQKYSNY